MLIHIAFVAMGFFIDMLLSFMFPVDFALKHLIFVSNMGIAALILSSRSMKPLDALILAFIAGFILDFSHYGLFMVYAVVYTLTILIVMLWSKHMTETLYELVILVIVGVFIKEGMIYGFMLLSGYTTMSLLTWLGRREFVTLIGNIPIIVVCIFLNDIKNNLMVYKENKLRRSEKLLWVKYKGKESR